MNAGLMRYDTMALMRNETRDVSRAPLLDLGYTFAWAGWQGDLKPDEFGLHVPTAPVAGLVRTATFLGLHDTPSDAGSVTQGWCALDAEDPAAVLKIHRTFEDPGTVVPRPQWRFARKDKDGAIVVDPCAFRLEQPVDKPSLVTIVYRSGPAKVMGLGQAAVRDFVSHLKNGELRSSLNSRPGDGQHFIGYGYSQSARFLRDFIYRGFNADTRGRRVFDGVLDTAAGAGRGSFNHRYASPGQAGNSVLSVLRAVDLYPFANLPTPDIDGKGKDGLLVRAQRDGVQPKIMHILNSSEYWARAGSLLQTTTDGSRMLPEAPGSRTYAFAGTAHGPRGATTYLVEDSRADYPYNDSDDLFLALPALAEAMRNWVSKGIDPPPSRAPSLGTTLVKPSMLRFPEVPGVKVPKSLPPVWQMDLGPKYKSKGILSEPPKLGPLYPLLVPQVDADGNEIGSWRGLNLSVPLGTYTAWNRQRPELDSFGFLSALQGSFFPFPQTRRLVNNARIRVCPSPSATADSAVT
jgi:hypothetical protein